MLPLVAAVDRLSHFLLSVGLELQEGSEGDDQLSCKEMQRKSRAIRSLGAYLHSVMIAGLPQNLFLFSILRVKLWITLSLR